MEMKKVYLKPELETIEISTTGMLATSPVLPEREVDDITVGSKSLEMTPEELLGISFYKEL